MPKVSKKSILPTDSKEIKKKNAESASKEVPETINKGIAKIFPEEI